MDDLSPEAILGIAAAVVAGATGLGLLAVRLACPRMYAATCGTRVPAPKFKPREKAVRPDTLEISHNPMVVVSFPNPRAHALPWEVDVDSVNKIRRLKQEFKPSLHHK